MVQLKILTEIESALNYKDYDIRFYSNKVVVKSR